MRKRKASNDRLHEPYHAGHDRHAPKVELADYAGPQQVEMFLHREGPHGAVYHQDAKNRGDVGKVKEAEEHVRARVPVKE